MFIYVVTFHQTLFFNRVPLGPAQPGTDQLLLHVLSTGSTFSLSVSMVTGEKQP